VVFVNQESLPWTLADGGNDHPAALKPPQLFCTPKLQATSPWKYDARPFTQGAFELNTVNTSKEGLDCQL